jgi:hypothetical protein
MPVPASASETPPADGSRGGPRRWRGVGLLPLLAIALGLLVLNDWAGSRAVQPPPRVLVP